MKNPGSRFQVVESAARNPGESIVTKTAQGPFIDTGLDLGMPDRPIFRGRVYLSLDEVREMADQFGLFEPYEDAREQRELEHKGDLADAREDGYASGYAAKVDATADELVERMRARVSSDRGARRDDQPAEDDSAADSAAEPVAEAAGVEGLDDVPGAEPAGSPE